MRWRSSQVSNWNVRIASYLSNPSDLHLALTGLWFSMKPEVQCKDCRVKKDSWTPPVQFVFFAHTVSSWKENLDIQSTPGTEPIWPGDKGRACDAFWPGCSQSFFLSQAAGVDQQNTRLHYRNKCLFFCISNKRQNISPVLIKKDTCNEPTIWK